MNERIKQLAEQAWKEILDETSIDGDISTMFSADEVVAFEQKFAELIVRECADVIQKKVSMKYKDGGETEEFMGGHYAGSVLARVEIRKHFGVEE